MDFTIAPSTDAQALSAISRATFLETYADMIPWPDMAAHNASQNSPAAIAARLAGEDMAWLVSVSATAVPIGLMLACAPELPVDTVETDWELKRIYLLAKYQGGGTGRAMMEAVVSEARARGKRRLLLGTHQDNPVVDYYRHMGFAVIGRRTFTVGTQSYPDVVMARVLETQ